MHIYSDTEIQPDLLTGKRIAMIGYGNQGRPQALNLRDSGFRVIVGVRRGGASAAKAADEGFEVLPIADAVAGADLVMLCVPDTQMAAIYRESVAPVMRSGAALAFCHGFNIRYGLIQPAEDMDVILISPKAAGVGVRALYEAGKGAPALIAVHQDISGHAEPLALAYGWGIGAGRAFMMRTSFAEETETDLFGEQAVLCGGIPALVRAGFEILVEAGYQPEVAYFECLHETKLIVDLIVERGLAGMREAISDTAEWGGFRAGEQLIDEATRNRMRELLGRIRDGSFAEDWVRETHDGLPRLGPLREAEAAHPIESVGREVRKRMVGPD